MPTSSFGRADADKAKWIEIACVGVRTVMFVCVGNSYRSQIAQGFANAYARPGTVEARSGGTAPFGHVSSTAVSAMADKGIDITAHKSKPIDLEFAAKADALISLCGSLGTACPAQVARRAIVWDVGEPGVDPATGRGGIRDLIEERVKELLRSWNALREDL